MAKKKSAMDGIVTREIQQFNTVDMSEEEIVDVASEQLDQLCCQLAEGGLSSDLVTAALFRLFAERMCDSGDRETYETVLELALEDEWEEVTIH
jgi:hypothetical protein